MHRFMCSNGYIQWAFRIPRRVMRFRRNNHNPSIPRSTDFWHEVVYFSLTSQTGFEPPRRPLWDMVWWVWVAALLPIESVWREIRWLSLRMSALKSPTWKWALKGRRSRHSSLYVSAYFLSEKRFPRQNWRIKSLIETKVFRWCVSISAKNRVLNWQEHRVNKIDRSPSVLALQWWVVLIDGKE